VWPANPVIPGHEFAGEVVALGYDIAKATEYGEAISQLERVAIDPNLYCGHWIYVAQVMKICVSTTPARCPQRTVPLPIRSGAHGVAYLLPDTMVIRAKAR